MKRNDRKQEKVEKKLEIIQIIWLTLVSKHHFERCSTMSHNVNPLAYYTDMYNKQLEKAKQGNKTATVPTTPTCFYFRTSGCRKGSNCQFSHSLTASTSATPLCDFYGTPKGCRFGRTCRYRHEILNEVNLQTKYTTSFSFFFNKFAYPNP